MTFGHIAKRAISKSYIARKIPQIVGGRRVGGDVVPRYFFVVQRLGHQEESDPSAMILPNDAEALRHAERTIAELQKEKGYHDPTGFVIVRNDKNETILSVPFLPACA